jgi:WD40 repeat protein
MLTGSWDFTARLWDAAIGMPIGPAFHPPSPVEEVAFSPAGDLFLTGCQDGKSRLFRTVLDHPDPLELTRLRISVLTGLSLDSDGSILVLDHATWRSRRQELSRQDEPPGIADGQPRGGDGPAALRPIAAR